MGADIALNQIAFGKRRSLGYLPLLSLKSVTQNEDNRTNNSGAHELVSAAGATLSFLSQK